MNNIKICGLQKTTLLDYPGHVAATVFLGGCNFRCPFCHNADLLGNDAEIQYTYEELLQFLTKRRRLMEGVCITGGEPTLQAEALEKLIRAIRELGLLVKLDTNGTRPEVIRHLMEERLLDYVAMDIKSGPDRYPQTAGSPCMNLASIQESVEILKHSSIPYEFRTTIVLNRLALGSAAARTTIFKIMQSPTASSNQEALTALQKKSYCSLPRLSVRM